MKRKRKTAVRVTKEEENELSAKKLSKEIFTVLSIAYRISKIKHTSMSAQTVILNDEIILNYKLLYENQIYKLDLKYIENICNKPKLLDFLSNEANSVENIISINQGAVTFSGRVLLKFIKINKPWVNAKFKKPKWTNLDKISFLFTKEKPNLPKRKTLDESAPEGSLDKPHT